MKKLSIIAIAALAMVMACTQEKSIVPAEAGLTAITATHSQAATRSILEVDESGETANYAILWDAPDKILVGYAGAVSEFTSTNTERAAEATFTGKLPEGSGSLYGIYPAENGNTVNSDGTFSIVFKDDQSGYPGTYDPEAFPAVAVSDSKNLSFKNICSLLALKVGYDDVAKITLKANGGACFYGGIFTVIAEKGEPVIDDFTDDVYEITLTPDGTFDPEETYYMSVPPITFVDGVTFTLTKTDGTTTDFTIRSEVTAERSKVHVVPTFAMAGPGEPEEPLDPYTGHEYVDLGLPSGLLWATCNIGADSPEEYGDYFAWAETETKEDYSWGTYKWMQKDQASWKYITKYTFDDGQTTGIWYYNEYDGEEIMNSTFVGDDGDGVAHNDYESYDYEDDPAVQIWGGTWRTPTPEDFQELINNTTITWTDNYEGTGIAGRLFTASNGNDLFLPAAGYRGGTNLFEDGSAGYYWSSSLSEERGSDDARELFFFKGYIVVNTGSRRDVGMSVRPVSEYSE